MTKLIIKDKGFFITIPKIAPFRTPAIVNISKLDVNQVLIELRKYGIEDFVIKYEPDKKDIQQEQILNYKSKKEEKIFIEKNHNEIFGKRIQNIEKLLKELVKNKTSQVIIEKTIINKETDSIKKEKEDDFDEDDFIPDIDISNLKLKESKSTKREEVNTNNIKKTSDLLSNLLKKGK